MQHPNTGQAAGSPRLRPHRAPSSPALGGAGGPPFWDEPLNRRARRAFYGRPRRIAADGPIAMDAGERARIEHNIATLIDLLDASEAPDQDREETGEDCCEAGDGLPGDADDAEEDDPQGGEDADREPSLGWTVSGLIGGTDDLEDATADAEPSDAHDGCGDRLTTVSGGVPL